MITSIAGHSSYYDNIFIPPYGFMDFVYILVGFANDSLELVNDSVELVNDSVGLVND